MPRAPAFSDTEIIEASIAIAGRGSPITPYTLMGYLGGSSLPYMKNALARLVRDGKIKGAKGVPSENEQVIQSFVKLLEQHRADSRVEAFEEYKEARTKLESTIADLRSKLEAANLRNVDLDKLFNNSKAAAAKLELDLKEAKDSEYRLSIELAKAEEKISATTEALIKAEKQAEHNLERLHHAHEQHQVERRELLDRSASISTEARAEIIAKHKQLTDSQATEVSLRQQLRMAMDDGLAHTKDIAGLRNLIRTLEGGRALLKKYGTWERVAELCKIGFVRDKK